MSNFIAVQGIIEFIVLTVLCAVIHALLAAPPGHKSATGIESESEWNEMRNCAGKVCSSQLVA